MYNPVCGIISIISENYLQRIFSPYMWSLPPTTCSFVGCWGMFIYLCLIKTSSECLHPELALWIKLNWIELVTMKVVMETCSAANASVLRRNHWSERMKKKSKIMKVNLLKNETQVTVFYVTMNYKALDLLCHIITAFLLCSLFSPIKRFFFQFIN